MDADIVLPLMLAAIFAMAGAHHLLIWTRDTLARDHFWFGVASLAAAGAAAIASVSLVAPAQPLSAFLALVWLVAAIQFILNCGGGDEKRRRAAVLATVLLAVVCLGDLALPLGPAWPRSGLLALGAVPLVIVVWLAIDGALRLWSSARRIRAAALGGFALFLCVVALHGILEDKAAPELPLLALCVFLAIVVIMTYELARAVADAEIASQRQHQELVHASRLSILGELTATIAHEINQPLGAILSNADAGEILLEQSDPPLDEIRRILSDIRRDGLRASDVIRHVRRLVRRRELELEKLDGNAIVADVIALVEPEARRRRIPIAGVTSPGAAYLRGDRALLEQVLINLQLNAMDAMEAQYAADTAPSMASPVLLSVSVTDHGEIEFQTIDSGPGIPAERLSHLFDSFYTSKSHGMGLGLSIARSIVEAHGGRIQAENNRDGGAKFWVTLPPYDELRG